MEVIELKNNCKHLEIEFVSDDTEEGKYIVKVYICRLCNKYYHEYRDLNHNIIQSKTKWLD